MNFADGFAVLGETSPSHSLPRRTHLLHPIRFNFTCALTNFASPGSADDGSRLFSVRTCSRLAMAFAMPFVSVIA